MGTGVLMSLRAHLERNLVQAEQLGQTDRVAKLKARLGDLDAPEVASLSMVNSKAELVAAAEATGVDVDESWTKAEILEALDGD